MHPSLLDSFIRNPLPYVVMLMLLAIGAVCGIFGIKKADKKLGLATFGFGVAIVLCGMWGSHWTQDHYRPSIMWSASMNRQMQEFGEVAAMINIVAAFAVALPLDILGMIALSRAKKKAGLVP